MSMITLEGHFQMQYSLWSKAQFQLEQKIIPFLYLSLVARIPTYK